MKTLNKSLLKFCFVAAVVLLLFGLSGHIDLSSLFVYTVGGPCTDLDRALELFGPCQDTPVVTKIDWEEVVIFALAMFIGMVLWSFVDQYKQNKKRIKHPRA